MICLTCGYETEEDAQQRRRLQLRIEVALISKDGSFQAGRESCRSPFRISHVDLVLGGNGRRGSARFKDSSDSSRLTVICLYLAIQIAQATLK